MAWIGIVTLACVVVYVQSHGHLIVPSNRASVWRIGYKVTPDFDDASMNCGGISRHHIFNHGKCGICGDPYDDPRPRKHELGGIYGAGVIVANYKPGEIFTATVNLTAAHKGFWELRICPHPYFQEQACFDNGYLLELEEGGTKYYPKKGSVNYHVAYRMPKDLSCKHCVLQWKYTTGNDAGVCPDGIRRVGCGNQEQFFSCSDISVLENLPTGYKEIGPKNTYNRERRPIRAPRSLEEDIND